MAKNRYPFLFAFFALTVPASTAPAQQDYHYYYFKQRRDAQLSLIRVAVESVDPVLDAEAIRPAVEACGAELNSVTLLGSGSWHFVHVDWTQPAVIEALIAALSQDPAISFASPVFVAENGEWFTPTPNILVQTFEAVEAGNLLTSGGADFCSMPWGSLENGMILQSKSLNGLVVLQQANSLALDPQVRFAEPNMLFSGGCLFFPNDPGFPNCWGIHNTGQFGGTPDVDMDGPEAWDVTSSSPDVIVVVIDSGVQQDHPDIHQIPGVDLTSDAGDGGPVNPFDRHGTVVAGTISGIMNNELGTVGIAPDCVTASARAFISINSQGKWISESSWTVDALHWAQAAGARVTNNSNFYGFESSAIAQKYEETRAAGLVHFASAGNRASPKVEYPAILPSVVAANAIASDGSLAEFSSFGPDVDLSAPGVDIYTTDLTGADGYIIGNYVFLSGTSFSSSYSAGVAALFLSGHPEATASTVEEALKLSAVDWGDPGPDDIFGWGLVNAFNAISWDPQCAQTPQPGPEPGGSPKSRYLSIEPATGNRIAAISVTVQDAIPQGQSLVGRTMWVAEPTFFVPPDPAGAVFPIARLGCEPTFRDWSDVGVVHVYGPEIMPWTTYLIQSAYEACFSPTISMSSPLESRGARWADLAPLFNPPSETVQPDFVDVSAAVDRFRAVPDSPNFTYVDLHPEVPNQDVNFSDISMVVDSFRGVPYPFAVPCSCPPCP